MKKALRIILITLLLLAALSLAFFFTRPVVWYVDDPVSSYNLPRPSFVTASFRLSSHSPELVIVSPEAAVPETDKPTILLGRLAERRENVDAELLLDESAMWKTALSDDVECILYEATDAFAKGLAISLVKKDSNAFAVSYDSRIGASNFEEIKKETEKAGRVFLLTPVSSIYYARNTEKDLVVDFRDKAALESIDARYSVGIDMNEMVRRLLSGDEELPYALFTSKK